VVHLSLPDACRVPVGERITPRVFQDRFAVPSKWFHSAGFWPAFVLISVTKRTDRRPQRRAPQPV